MIINGLKKNCKKTVLNEWKEDSALTSVNEVSENEGMNEECDNEKAISIWKDNRGLGTVEIILIIVVLVGLVIIFQSQIKDIVSTALEKISGGANQVSF